MDFPRVLTQIMGTGEEFENFLHQNGIAHTQMGSYNPASNGLVEHAIQTFNKVLKDYVRVQSDVINMGCPYMFI